MIGPHPTTASIEASCACCSGPTILSALATVRLVDALGTQDVTASVDRIRLAQGGVAHEITVGTAAIGVDTRPASVDAGALAWQEDGGVELGGFLAMRFHATKALTLSADLKHDAIWRPSGAFDPLRGVRVRDLRQLDRRLTASEGRLAALLGDGRSYEARVDLGATVYGDGNRRAFLSASAARALKADRDLHVAFEPGIYVESFARSTPGFLTPLNHVRVAARSSARIRRGSLTIAADLAPHLYRDERSSGFGVSGEAGAMLSVVRSVVELTTEFTLQGSYRFLQIGFRVTGGREKGSM